MHRVLTDNRVSNILNNILYNDGVLTPRKFYRHV